MSEKRSTETTILGMPVVVNPTLPPDTVEIRSAHNRVRIINLETDPKGDNQETTERMTQRQVSAFEAGYAAFADGLPRQSPWPAPTDDARWWFRGWDASKEDNRCIYGR
jgi:hypothetical protein